MLRYPPRMFATAVKWQMKCEKILMTLLKWFRLRLTLLKLYLTLRYWCKIVHLIVTLYNTLNSAACMQLQIKLTTFQKCCLKTVIKETLVYIFRKKLETLSSNMRHKHSSFLDFMCVQLFAMDGVNCYLSGI